MLETNMPKGPRFWAILAAVFGVLLIGEIGVLALPDKDHEKSETQNQSTNASQDVEEDEAVVDVDEPEVENTDEETLDMAGTFRCWQYLVDGATSLNGCRLQAALVLNEDGTYSFSSEQGTYTVKGDTITLSESKIRGPGKILEQGMQIYFEYTLNGKDYTTTYLRLEE